MVQFSLEVALDRAKHVGELGGELDAMQQIMELISHGAGVAQIKESIRIRAEEILKELDDE